MSSEASPSNGLPSLGAVLGDFRLTDRIGEGGMGVIYQAQNVRVEKMVRAVKVVRAELAAQSTFRERFLREAEYMEVLRHDNILRVDNIGEQNGMLFMVMELLTGTTLEQLNGMRPGGLPIQQAVACMLQALAGLAHAHRNNIIHRDLKPSNLFLTNEGKIKILDFGIARHGESTSKLTNTGQAIPGSPAYYAPEFSEGASASPQSDIYALGISLFELLAGRLPFEGGGSSETQRLMSLLVQHSTKPLPDIRQFRREIPEPLISVLTRATAKVPAQRYPDARTFAVDLQAAFKASGCAPQNDSGRAAGAPAVSTRFAMPGSADVAAAVVAAQSVPAPTGGAASTQFALPTGHEVAAAAHGASPLSGTQFNLPPPAGGHAPASPTARPSHGKTSSLTTSLIIGGGLLATLGIGALVFTRKGDDKNHPGQQATNPKQKGEKSASAGQRPGAETPAGGQGAADGKPGEPPPPPGMVLVKGGTMKMGRADYGRPNALDVPEHEVQVKDLFIDKIEVTVGEYKEFVEAAEIAPPWGKIKDVTKIADLPVVNIAADDAIGYCRWRHPPRGRLPSEEEWERAARGREGRLYPFGNEFLRVCVNGLHGEAGVPQAADKHACGATPSGILDLSGNVWEWTSSKPSAYPGSTPTLPASDKFRIIRGGSFFNTDENDLTATVRQFAIVPNRFLGFRCAMDAPQ